MEKFQMDVKNYPQTKSICLHAYADLSHMVPVVFIYLLAECYKSGKRNATRKFRVFQHHLWEIFKNQPQPGSASFIVKCLYVVSMLGEPYTEFFGNLVISALCHLESYETSESDFAEAQSLAARLFLDAIAGLIMHEVHILIKVLDAFDVRLLHIGKAICGLEMYDAGLDVAKAHIEAYVCGLIEKKLYLHAVTFLERFSIRFHDESFLLKMMQEHQFKPAEKWATYMGKPMLRVIVEQYIHRRMIQHAYKIIKRNNLQGEFSDVYYICKESSLKELAEQGCWDIAEAKTLGDKLLVQYLVYLALEAGYSEKIVELCERYSLKGFFKITEREAYVRNPVQTKYLNLKQLGFDDVIWVDEVEGLLKATSYIEECRIIGIDCEWKPSDEKDSKPNKVSIIQVAGDKKVFIIDLLNLSVDEPDMLNSCFKRILLSPNTLKLGYNIHCDLKQLSHSYTEVECFKRYEMLLDIQNVFKEPRGGLSGLAKKILGAGLDKTGQSCNWEQRPLSQNQLEYAGLDAAVVVVLFYHICSRIHSKSACGNDAEREWRSYIVTHLDHKQKKLGKRKKKIHK